MAKHRLLWQWEKWERTCGSYCPVQKDRSQWICIKMALFKQQKHSCVTACPLDAIFSIAAKNAKSLWFTEIDTLCVAVVLSGVHFHDVKSCPKFLMKLVNQWFSTGFALGLQIWIPRIDQTVKMTNKSNRKIWNNDLLIIQWTAQTRHYAKLLYLFITLYMVLEICQHFPHDY